MKPAAFVRGLRSGSTTIWDSRQPLCFSFVKFCAPYIDYLVLLAHSGFYFRFEITDHEKNFKVTGLSTDECHSHLISLINKMLGPVDLIAANGNGDRFFGICTATVRLKLQSASKSKFCIGYIPLESQVTIYIYLLSSK